MTEPLSPGDIAELREHHDCEQCDHVRENYARLLDIAEDHARLHAENVILSEDLGEALAERDQLRAEVATLRKEREYRFADLATARERIEKLERVEQAARRYRRLGTEEFEASRNTLDAALAACEVEEKS